PMHHFLSICRRPPRSPLFPYTTLFRSIDVSDVQPPREELRERVQGGARRSRVVVRPEDRNTARPGVETLGVCANDVPTPGRAVLDRKSTRLNSSHVKISYAVFCLKKKT